MSSAARARSRSVLSALLVGLAVSSLVACAQGTMGGADDDDPRVDARRVDARVVDARPVDAPGPPVDARPVDAAIPVDASFDSGLPGGSCTMHSQCPMGECCFGGLMCVPGEVTPLPPPFDCLPSE
jgi:hypothetical protein